MNCEDCDYSDIADWEQDKITGKASPVYWCERYKKMCSSISECQYMAESERGMIYNITAKVVYSIEAA